MVAQIRQRGRSAHNVEMHVKYRPDIIILKHNYISNSTPFKSHIFNPNKNDPKNIQNMANLISNRLAIAGHYNKPTLDTFGSMVNRIINSRVNNQANYIRGHIIRLGAHHVAIANINRRIQNRKEKAIQENEIARNLTHQIYKKKYNMQGKVYTEQNRQQLANLIERRKNRINQIVNIQNLENSKKRHQNELAKNIERTSEHTRQISGWRWIRNIVLPTIKRNFPN